jgi:hypothetical protein
VRDAARLPAWLVEGVAAFLRRSGFSFGPDDHAHGHAETFP